MSGFDIAVIGLMLVASPFVATFQKYGEVSEEAIWRWFTSLSLESVLQLNVAVRLGLAMLAFGLFTLARPR